MRTRALDTFGRGIRSPRKIYIQTIGALAQTERHIAVAHCFVLRSIEHHFSTSQLTSQMLVLMLLVGEAARLAYCVEVIDGRIRQAEDTIVWPEVTAYECWYFFLHKTLLFCSEQTQQCDSDASDFQTVAKQCVPSLPEFDEHSVIGFAV